MTDLKKQIENFIISNRGDKPTLSNKSLTAYSSTLLNLYNNVFGSIADFDFNGFNDYKTILNYLKDTPPSTRKTKMATLLNIATDKKAIQEYKKIMSKDFENYNKEQNKNKATDEQKAVNLTQEQIHGLGEALKTTFNNELAELTKKHSPKKYGAYTKIELLKHILYMLTSGEHIPPRRLLDWVELKIGKIDKRTKSHEKVNYNIYDPKSGQFVINVYKLSGAMGTQYIQAPAEMKKDINKYIKLNGLTDGDYLIADKEGEPLTVSNLNKRLGTIYGKGRSVNMLRHSFITEKYDDLPSLESMTNTAEAMGQKRIDTHLKYIKK
jgi:hypothetical protein